MLLDQLLQFYEHSKRKQFNSFSQLFEKKYFETNTHNNKQTNMKTTTQKNGVGKIVSAFILSMVLAFSSLQSANAQVVVTGDGAGGSPYATLAAAITAVNGVGTLTQPTTITLQSGFPQTAPTSGYSITATGSISNTLTITGAGSGSIITAGLQTANFVNDAIFKIVGGDYITITGFQMQENSSNTVITPASNTMTEFGIAIYAATTINGAKNNTISNNTISLSATYTQSFGIFSTSTFSSANASTVTAQASVAGGENSNNKVIGNTISSVAFGISVVSPVSTATFSETGWIIGQSSAGNTINYVGNAAITTSYTNMSTTVHGGIIVRNVVGSTIRYNSVTSGTISLAATATNGIVLSAGTTPAGVTYTNNISNNTVNLTSSTNTSGTLTGIDFGYGISTGTITGDNNTVTINQNSANIAQSGLMIGIKAAYAAASSSVSSNNITVNQTANVTATTTNSSAFTGITTPNGTTGTPTMSILSNSILINRSSTASATFTSTLSGTQIGIQSTTATTTLNIGSVGNGNTITIKESVAGAGTNTYTSTITCVDVSATHATANVVGNTINTTGSTIRSTGTLICVKPEATVTVLYNIKSNSAIIDRVAATGAISFTTQTGSPSNVADTVSSNTITFSSLAGSTSATGISELGGPSTSGVKSICNNTINISGTNTGATTGIAWGYSSGSKVAGNSIIISNAATTLIGLNPNNTSAGAGYFVPSSGPGNGLPLYGSISLNTISLTSSTTSPTSMIGINAGTSGSGPYNIYNNTFSALNFNGVVTGSPVVSGIVVGVGTNDSIYNNIVKNITVGAATSSASPTTDGILVSGGTTPYVFKNKIYGIVSNSTGTTGVVNGIRISSVATAAYVYNNYIGNLAATTSANPDGIRGVSITSSSTSTNYIHFNTIFLNGTSTGANFGGSGIFHTASVTATTAVLDLRNNIIINRIVPVGTGLTVALRRSGVALNNYATISNKNLLYAGTPSASKLIYSDATNSYQTLASFQGATISAIAVAPREASSIGGEVTWQEGSATPYETAGNFFQSLTGSATTYLHLVSGITTLVESGGTVVSSPIAITQDYDGDTRNTSTPDIGADEFSGQSPAPSNSNLSTPANVCTTGSSRTVTVDATTPTGTTITGVTITYNNGSATGPVAMTNTSGNTWSYDIPSGTAGTTVTWSVTSTNNIGLTATTNGTSFIYLPLNGATTSANAASTSVCTGGSTTLSATLKKAGLGTVGTGASTSSSLGTTIFPGSWGGAKVQYLVRKSELNAAGLFAGNITSLTFRPTSGGQAYPGFAISMAHASGTNGVMSNSFISTSDVYAPGTSFTPTIGSDNTITFTSPFNWNGTNDVIVSICWSTALTTSTSCTVQTDAVGFNSSYGWQVDSQTPATVCGTTGTPSGGNTPVLSTSRPKFIFGGIVAATIAGYSWSDGNSFTSTSATPSVTPALGANTYTVNLTASGCTTSASTSPASPSVQITGIALPAAPNSDNTPTAQCGVITYTATGAVVGSYYSFYSVPTGGTKLDSNTTGIYKMLAPVQGIINTVYVAVTNTSGCVSATRTQFDVFANIPATLSLSQSTVASCVGRVETLSVTSTLSDYDSYTWSPTTNLYTNAAATVAYNGTGNPTTIYYKRSSATASETITLTAVNSTSGSGNEGCTNTASAIFTVNANPTIASATALPASVCSGGNVTLTGLTNVIGSGTAPVGAGASTSASSGTSSVNYASPYSHYFGGLKVQYMIKASELSGAGISAGNLSSVGFDVASAGTAYTGFMIQVGTTSASALTTTFATGLTQVYYAGIAGTVTPTVGINTYSFGTGSGSSSTVSWNGTDNVIVEISWSNNNGGGTAAEVKYDTPSPSFNCFTKAATDNVTVSANQALTTGTVGTLRPKIVLGGQVQTTGAGTLNWSWNNGGPSASTGIVNPTNIPAGSTATTVIYTVTGTSASAPFCSSSLAASAVTVNSLAVSPTNTSNANQCGTPTFSVSTGLSGNVTYKWYDAANSGNLVTTTTRSTGSSSYIFNSYVGGVNSLYVSVTATGGCESGRTQCDVTVTNPPTLVVNKTGAVQTCVNKIETLDITTGNASFTSYVWTPNTNLYTDAAATVAYNGTGNLTTVYYKRSNVVASEAITLTAVVGACTATSVATFNVGANPVVSTAVATPATVCNGATVNLSGTALGVGIGTATVGTGVVNNATSSTTSTGYPAPFGNYYQGAKNQMLITATDLTAAGLRAGNITSVAFDVVTPVTTALSGFNVAIKATSLNSLTSFETLDFTTVYAVASYSPSSTAGYAANTITFSTPFNWDGTSNIIIQTCFANTGFTTNAVFNQSTTSYQSTLVYRADLTTVCSAAPSITFSYSQRPNMKFGGQAVVDVTSSYNWTWSTTGVLGTSVVSGASTTHIATNAGSTVTSVTYTATATNSATGCYGSLNGTAITVNPTPTSPANTSAASQCGTPTFSVSTGISGTVTYKWYDAASAGNLVTTTSSNTGSSFYVQNSFTGGGATNSLWVSVTDPITGCESGRTQLNVIVNTPVALSITPASLTNVCAGSINAISVNSGAGTYTTYNWTPTTNLYTDAVATVAYNGTGNPTTLYYKRSSASAADTIRLAASYFNSGTTCSNNTIAMFNVAANPTIDSTLITPTTICSGNAVSLYAGSNNVTTGTATIGAGAVASTSTAASFFPGFWGGTKTQYIIKASELIAAGISAGNLTSLTFETTTSGQQYQGFYVHLGLTAQAAATTTFIPNANLTQVYFGTEGTDNGFTPDASNPNTLTFGTGSGSNANFNWDGTSNIVVSISWSRVPSASTATASSMNVDNPGFTCSVYKQVDNQTPAQMLAQTTGTSTGTSRPKFTFGAQVLNNNGNGYNWTWSNGTSNVLSANTGMINPTNVTSSPVNVTYSVTATLASAPSCSTTKTSVATITVNPIPPAPTDNGTVANQCGLPTYTVSTSISSPTINWYTSASGGSSISSGSSLSYVYTGYTVGVNTLYVSVTSGGCEGARTAITVTVSSPASIALTKTGTVTTCLNRIETLSVTGGTVGNYSNFSWTPITNLYTDAAATVAYTGTGNPTTVYYKRSSSNSAEVITLSVSNSGAGACINTTSVTMNVNPNPTITTLTATPTTVCSGSAVNLNGTSFGAITSNLGEISETGFGSLSGYGMYFNSPNASRINTVDVYPSTAGTLTIQLLNSSSTVIDSRSFTIVAGDISTTVAKTLAVNFNIPAGSTAWQLYYSSLAINRGQLTYNYPYTNASGFSITGNTIDGNNIIGGSRFYFYNWNVTDTANISSSYTWAWTTTHSGVSITNGASTTHIPTNTTSAPITAGYSVTVTNAATTCVSTGNTNTVTVNYIAAAPTNATTSSQCGTPTYAITTSETGATINWYTKATGGTALSSSSSLSYVYATYPTNASGNDTLWASVSKNGCESGRTQIIVAVGTPPALSVSTPTASTCVNRVTALSVSSTLSNYNVYAWSPTTNLYTDAAGTVVYNGTGNPTTIYYKRGSATGSETITLSASSASGCTNVKTAIFTVNANPVITTATASPTAVCSGGNVTLTAASFPSTTGTATIGTATTLTGATTQPTAFCNRWPSYRMQTVYTAAELTAAGLAAGNITSMAFNITTLGDGATNANYTVKIGNTSLSTLTAFADTTTGFTTVYPSQTYTHAVGLNTITFATPFVWNGTSNIIVQVVHSGADLTNNSITYYTATTGNTVAYTATASTNAASLSTNRLNVVFGGIVGTNYTSSLSWSWSNGSSTVLSTATGSVTPINNGSTSTNVTYSVTATDANTCSTTSAVTTGAVTVNSGTVGGTPSSLIVCLGFQPSNNISLVGSLGSVVRWEKSTDASFSTGVTNIINTTTTLTAAEVGTISAVTYVRALVQSGVCSSVYSSNGVLTPVVTVGGSASSQTVCVTGGGTAPSNNVVLTGYQGSVVKWQKSTDSSFTTGVVDISSTSASLPGSSVGAISATTYVRALVQNATCSQLYSSFGTLTVFDGSASTISISTTSTTICSGSNTVFTAVASNPGSTPVYQWKRNGTVVGTNSSTLAFASNTLVTGDVIVCTVTSSNPCALPAVATSNTLTLSVTPSPAVGAIYRANGSTITAASLCSFADTLFVRDYTTGGVWGSSNSSVASITPIATNTSEKYAYILPVSRGATNISYTLLSSGCASTASFQLKVAPATTPAAITAQGGVSSVCAGSTLQLTSTTAPIGSTSTWAISSGSSWAAISNTGLLSGSNAGTPTIRYTISNDSGCSSYKERVITVNAIPAVPLMAYGSNSGNPIAGTGVSGQYCVGKKFTVVGNPTGGHWTFTNTGVATIADSLVSANNWWGTVRIIGVGTGNIVYTVTNSAGCSNKRVMVGSGVTCASRGVDINSDATKPLLDFTLYPNPAKGRVSFNIDFVEAGGKVILTDMYGKQVKTQSLSIGTNQVDINTLSKGFYLVSVITNDGSRSTKKLIVE